MRGVENVISAVFLVALAISLAAVFAHAAFTYFASEKPVSIDFKGSAKVTDHIYSLGKLVVVDIVSSCSGSCGETASIDVYALTYSGSVRLQAYPSSSIPIYSGVNKFSIAFIAPENSYAALIVIHFGGSTYRVQVNL